MNPSGATMEGQQSPATNMGGMNQSPAGQGPPEGMMPPQPQPAQPAVDYNTTTPKSILDSIRKTMESRNLAEGMDEDKLVEIGQQCRRGFDEDKESREGWESDIEDWMALATQQRDVKNFPWPNAANIKYPLLGIAAMQFSARAYPSLVPANGQIVLAKVYGKDPDGQKNLRATRVSQYMSYQFAVEMENWEEDMDRLLMQVSVTGNMFKKTWFDPAKDRIRSEIISAADLVVNYWADSLETAERISQIVRLYPRQIRELQRKGIYLEMDLPTQGTPEGGFDVEGQELEQSKNVTPYEIIEQHTYLDLKDDGYDAPYIVSFDRHSGQVFRITANFDADNIIINDKNDLVSIPPIQYFTKFGFIPNPNGSFYDLGFGHLLGPLNEAVNTIINQLTDAGTLNNMQSGFLGKGLRIKGGNYSFKPGEWKWVNSVIDDLKKQILPLPTKEPSATLLKLLEVLITSGKELASVAEIFVGKMPGQNTPATTTMAGIEQGMKVFTAIYKRQYRALGKEFRKVFKLNKAYTNPETEAAVLEEPIGAGDFDDRIMHIVPSADPSASSQQENLAKAQSLMELLPLGTLDPMEVTQRILKAMEQPNWEALIPGMKETGQPQPPPQPPDPKAQEMEMKGKLQQQAAAEKSQLEEKKFDLASRDKEQQMAMEQQQGQEEIQHKKTLNQIKAEEAAIKLQTARAAAGQKMQQSHDMHQQKLREHASKPKK